MRASGICNTFGRGATVLTPFLVVPLFTTYGVGGVLTLMIALLALMIGTVWALGVEPSGLSLEQMATATEPGAPMLAVSRP